jgi:hypothetical protein
MLFVLVLVGHSDMKSYIAYTKAEVLPLLRSQVMGGKYLVQYAFAAAGSASIVPLIESVGIGSACTISKFHFGRKV